MQGSRERRVLALVGFGGNDVDTQRPVVHAGYRNHHGTPREEWHQFDKHIFLLWLFSEWDIPPRNRLRGGNQAVGGTRLGISGIQPQLRKDPRLAAGDGAERFQKGFAGEDVAWKPGDCAANSSGCAVNSGLMHRKVCGEYLHHPEIMGYNLRTGCVE